MGKRRKKQVNLRDKTSDKKIRHEKILNNYEGILLMGDTLADFSPLFYKQSLEKRNALVDQFKSEFGKRFIVIPNTVYGEWESSLYEYNHGLGDDLKIQAIKNELRKKI